jgi:hypothetical protein
MATPTTLPASFVSGAVLTAAEMNNLRGAFRVLQVVNGQNTGSFNRASNVYADWTSVTTTITPSSLTSKILVIVTPWRTYNLGAGSDWVQLRLMRDATEVAYSNAYVPSNASGGYNYGIPHIMYFETATSTSAVTYKAQVSSINSYSINWLGGSITTMEISA